MTARIAEINSPAGQHIISSACLPAVSLLNVAREEKAETGCTNNNNHQPSFAITLQCRVVGGVAVQLVLLLSILHLKLDLLQYVLSVGLSALHISIQQQNMNWNTFEICGRSLGKETTKR